MEPLASHALLDPTAMGELALAINALMDTTAMQELPLAIYALLDTITMQELAIASCALLDPTALKIQLHALDAPQDSQPQFLVQHHLLIAVSQSVPRGLSMWRLESPHCPVLYIMTFPLIWPMTTASHRIRCSAQMG